MDLREAGVRKQRASLVRAPARRHIRSLGIRRQVIDVPVTARRQHHRIRHIRRISPVTRLRATMPRALPSITIRSSISVRANISTVARVHLPLQRLVGAQQQLLPRLPAR